MLEKTHGEDEEKSLDLFVVGFGFLVIMGGLWFLPELGLEANETIILRTESGRLLEAYEDGGIGYSPPPPKAANFVTKIVKKKGLLNRVMLKTYYGHFLTYDRKLKGYATMDRPSLTEVFDDNEALLFSESRYGHIFHPWEKEKREKGNRAMAKDLSQEVFLKVWNNLDKFRGDASPKTWIYRITINTCIQQVKKEEFDILFYGVFLAGFLILIC